MKHLTTLLLLLFSAALLQGQATFKEHKAGHVFYLSLPDYVQKTMGLNDAASLQFRNDELAVYGIVIVDDKSEMKDFDMSFASLEDYYKDFAGNFLKDLDRRRVGLPVSKTQGSVKFMECDASYYDKELGGELAYLVACAETPTAFFKIICWTTMGNRIKYKEDFRKIIYSLRD